MPSSEPAVFSLHEFEAFPWLIHSSASTVVPLYLFKSFPALFLSLPSFFVLFFFFFLHWGGGGGGGGGPTWPAAHLLMWQNDVAWAVLFCFCFFSRHAGTLPSCYNLKKIKKEESQTLLISAGDLSGQISIIWHKQLKVVWNLYPVKEKMIGPRTNAGEASF